jgi:geranylgeranyl diphosphate synthase type I
LGYVFQIRDDYLGVWGDEDSTGKPVGADIRRKKNSFPVVYAMSNAGGRDREFLAETYKKDHLTDNDVATVLDIMERANVKDHAQRLAEHHCENALKALEGVELAQGIRRELEGLAQFLLVRDR